MQNNICKVSCKYKNKTHTYSVQFRPSVVSDSLRPHVLQHTRPPRPVTNSRSPPKPMSIESVMPSSHLILCCPLLLLPPIPPSIRVFSNESTLCMRWPKYCSFRFSIIPSKEIIGLIHHSYWKWVWKWHVSDAIMVIKKIVLMVYFLDWFSECFMLAFFHFYWPGTRHPHMHFYILLIK